MNRQFGIEKNKWKDHTIVIVLTENDDDDEEDELRIKDSDVVLIQKSNNNNSDTYRAAERERENWSHVLRARAKERCEKSFHDWLAMQYRQKRGWTTDGIASKNYSVPPKIFTVICLENY